MEKDIGKIKKNTETDIVVRIDDFGGKVGLTIREFTNSERYSGFTKSGTRIPAEELENFKKLVASIDVEEIKKLASESGSAQESQQNPSTSSSEESYI